MSIGRPRTTPCIGKCSHNVGDEICKGCNRTVAEVRDWNTLSVAEKISKMEELKMRSAPLIVTDTPRPIISWNDL